MSKKFGKNREVDRSYLNVPVKYILNYTGKHEDGMDHYRDITYEEWREKTRKLYLDFDGKEPTENQLSMEEYKACLKLAEKWDSSIWKIKSKEAKDKTLCIVDFYGKNALVGWRNNKTCKMGMTRLYPLVWKHGKLFLKYKDNLIQLSNTGGWVI
jgi:hypothetical protein